MTLGLSLATTLRPILSTTVRTRPAGSSPARPRGTGTAPQRATLRRDGVMMREVQSLRRCRGGSRAPGTVGGGAGGAELRRSWMRAGSTRCSSRATACCCEPRSCSTPPLALGHHDGSRSGAARLRLTAPSTRTLVRKAGFRGANPAISVYGDTFTVKEPAKTSGGQPTSLRLNAYRGGLAGFTGRAACGARVH